MSTKSYLSAAAVGLALAVPAWGQQTAIDVFSFDNPFYDAGGVTPLDGGGNSVGDGDLVQLGYFNGITSATPAASFTDAEWNTFTPISGRDSLNPHLITEVGPLNWPGQTGQFTFQLLYDASGGSIDVLPPNFAFRVGLRVFDGNTIATSTHFNTVASDASEWYLPPLSGAGFPGPTPPLISFDGGQTLVFQGAPFVTSILVPVAPEPSSSLLLAFAAGFLFQRRKR